MKKQEANNISKDKNNLYLSLKSTIEVLTEDLKEVNKRRDEIIKKATVKIDKERDAVLVELIKYQKSMEDLFPEDTYPESGWKQKIIWALIKTKKVMTASDIASKIKKHESQKEYELLPVLRLTINRMNDKQELIRFKNEDTVGIHYGLPEWFENGKLMEGYY